MIKNRSSLALATVLSLSATFSAAQGNGNGLETAAAKMPVSLFSSHPSYGVPRKYGIGALQGELDSRGLARGAPLLQIELPNGRTVVLAGRDVDRRGASDLAWFGAVSGSEDSDASLTLKNGLIFGRIREGDEVFELSSDLQGTLTVEQIDTSNLPACDTDDAHVHSGEGAPGAASSDAQAAAGDAGVLIDLLVVYSNDALADSGSVAQMHAKAQAAVDAANAAFANSNMTARFRLVHTAGVNYNTGGTTGADLSWVTDDPEVAALRNEYGADMVHLLVDTPDSCGTAWVQRNPGPGFEDNAFAVTDVDCAVGNLTFAHEHGHNMGFEHNIENSGATRTSASNPWSFAYYVDGSYRTVMSYSDQCTSGCSRVTQFSNPNILFNGSPSGVANESDNARTGDQTAPIVSNFRADVVPSTGTVTFAAIGDYGDGSVAESDVADLINGWGVDFVIGAGDNRYGSISYDTSVGRDYCNFMTDVSSGSYCAGGISATNAFFPAPGNHDYTDGSGINEYLSYFSLPGAGVQTSGTSGSERYYDVVQGPVHIFVIDSQAARGSTQEMNAQKAWLQTAMEASTAAWQVVLLHHAPYSSGSHGSYPELQWPYAAWGADAVFAGHDHIYERLTADGIPYFVTGLGGRSIYSYGSIKSNSDFRYNGDYGAMRVTASEGEMTFEFIDRSGTLIDSHMVDKTPTPGNGIVNVRVSQSSDDAEELVSTSASYSAGHISLDSSDLELADDNSWHGGTQEIGIRFQGINIPQGATITAASLEFVTDVAHSAAATVSIRAQDSDYATTFTAASYDISNRPETSASVTWNMGSWDTVGETHTSPDLSTVVQEVVDRFGWQPNNAMAFLITGSGIREAESYDGAPAQAPLLHVEYSVPTANVTLPYFENFNDAQAQDFSAQDSAWGVTGDAYEVSTSADPSVSVVSYDATGLSTANISATIEGLGGNWQNGFIVFDYNSLTDFKFAGAFFGANLWRIGHYTASGPVHDVEVSESLALSTVYNAEVRLDGTVATLFIGGVEKASFDFGEDLLAGTAGLGVMQAHSRFDDFSINSIGGAIGIHEAENATLNGAMVADSQPGYSGTGFADYINASNDYVEWTVHSENPGQVALRFRYALASGDRPLAITVNGEVVDSALSFPATGSFGTWAKTTDVVTSLNAGSNTIRATAIGSSGANVDYLEIESYSPTNLAPTASFEFSVTDLTVDFTDASGDSDGTIVGWNWNFGDGGSSSAQNPSHTYAATGTYNVMLTVTDDDGATGSANASIAITVPDTQAPSISAPADVWIEATGVTTDVSLGSPVVSDNEDPNPSVTNDAPAGFPVGVTTVTWTVTDAAGNSATATQSVTVTDTTAPVISAPADVSVESSGPIAVNLGTPSVNDLVDPNPVVSNNAPAAFDPGTTTVTWTATDATGNSATSTQTVTVIEPEPQPPAAPSNLTASVQETGKGKNREVTAITLTWADNSENETGFVVEGCRKSGKRKNATCLFSEIGTSNTSSFPVDLNSGHDRFRVKAVNEVGSSAWSNEVDI